MDIVWNGHACFRLRGRDATIVTDPYDRTTGFPALKLTADVVTISNTHPHHASLEVVQPPGKKPMSAAEFLRGHDPPKNAR